MWIFICTPVFFCLHFRPWMKAVNSFLQWVIKGGTMGRPPSSTYEIIDYSTPISLSTQHDHCEPSSKLEQVSGPLCNKGISLMISSFMGLSVTSHYFIKIK